jgi:hypothetical protein
MDLVEKYLGEKKKDKKKKKGKPVYVHKGDDKLVSLRTYTLKETNLLGIVGSIGKMPGQWGKRLGTFGTVLAKALKDAGVDIIGIEPLGKFDNEITVSYKGKQKKIKLDGNSSAAKVVKKITGK